ncbi:hypothetical protein PFISCL1PPCAC_9410, partial [Pristionchus fissidentatus]
VQQLLQSAQPQTSPAWRYYTKLPDNLARCHGCSYVAKRLNSGTSVMLNHLKSHHPAWYDDVKESLKPSNQRIVKRPNEIGLGPTPKRLVIRYGGDEQRSMLHASGLSIPAAAAAALTTPPTQPTLPDNPTYPVLSSALSAAHSKSEQTPYTSHLFQDSAPSNGETETLAELMKSFVKEEEMEDDQPIMDGREDMREGTSESSAQMPLYKGSDEEIDQSPEFWRVFELTKKVYAVMKNEFGQSNGNVNVRQSNGHGNNNGD